MFRSSRISTGIIVVSALVAMLAVSACSHGASARKYSYPAAKTVDQSDVYHGTTVKDPYRWLENADNPETLAWVEQQNQLSRDYVKGYTGYEAMRERLTKLWNYEKYRLPVPRGERYFFVKNDGLQNQSVLYVQTGMKGEPAVVLDPNTWSDDGTVALSSWTPSMDGSLLAYAQSANGSDGQVIKVADVTGAKTYSDELQFCRFSSVAWKKDNSGFFYNRYPDPATVAKEDSTKYMRVYFHKVGTPQSDDVLVHEDKDDKDLGFWPVATEDGAYLILYVARGGEKSNMLWYRPMDSDSPFVKLIDTDDARYDFIDNDGGVFYIRTDLDAPRSRVIAIDTAKSGRDQWKEIVPQQEDVLDFAGVVNKQLVMVYMHDAQHRMRLYDLKGTFEKEIELPTIGSIYGISGRRDDAAMFYSFASFLYPTTMFRYDFATGKSTVFRKSAIDFDPSGYETKQVFYTSKDGTKVPMFITHKKGIKLDGNNPTLLYGYGGFKINLTPYFSIHRIVWMEQGGVFAVANLRGGDEYGEAWHRAGQLENKQNVFDDFIAGSEWLIENGYTSPKKLAIQGGSNGGLLVAAVMLQRPELFGAIACHVPVIDMLRYHKFTVGHFWIPEYGNAEENPEHFKFMYAYSPLHNVKPGVAYPATYITTGDTDDRVAPGHAKKFAATLQAQDAGQFPILLYVETKAGHGAGKPTAKIIEERVDIYAFLLRALGMDK